MHRPVFAALTLAAATALAVVLTASPALGADRCPRSFTCSVLPVPLDRADPHAATLDLRVARHTASAGAGKPALIVLAGGPGQAAVPFASQFVREFRPALRRYQLVVFDQRGTGASGAIDCPRLQEAGDAATLDEARTATAACGSALGNRAGDYPTAASVEDIEAVRQAVGADRVALVGTSYGTHVIQRYLAAHPDRVDRIVLDSTVAPGGVDAFQTDAYSATARILHELRPGAVAQTARLVRRLGRGSLAGIAYGPDGRARTVTIHSSGDLFNLLTAGDLNTLLRGQFAPAVRSANRGDRTPLARLQMLSQEPPTPVRILSMGLYAATTCADVRMPWAHDAPIDARAPLFAASVAALDPAPLRPFDIAAARDTSLSGACLGWPPIAAAPDAIPAGYAHVPALILSGLSDVRTPVESARKVAALIPGARLLTVPGTGHDVSHSDATGCAARAVSRFLLGRDPGGACRRGNHLDRSMGNFPLRLHDVPPTGGRGRPARALTAAVRTVRDAERVALLSQPAATRAGGLRGGTLRARVRARGVRLRLDRYVFLPGLRVTGTLRLTRRAEGRMRLSGIARGTVVYSGRRITATIDGRRLRRRI